LKTPLGAKFSRAPKGSANPGNRKTMDIRNLADAQPFTTKDGSQIRELLAHRNSCIRNQTLAEARVEAGRSTTPHRHVRTEEIYYIVQGVGLMRIDGQTQPVRPGDAVAIPPGAVHQITNTGAESLVFLCCCAPGYEHSDTILDE
jgi:mannose-6-phosphate isomerase-like protein (cupin superfamily)